MSTTALDFAAMGVRFIHAGAAMTVKGPAGRRDIAELLRAEIARRVSMLDSLKVARKVIGPVGLERCETCGDPLACGRGGMCDLCCAARRKIVAGRPTWRLEAA